MGSGLCRPLRTAGSHPRTRPCPDCSRWVSSVFSRLCRVKPQRPDRAKPTVLDCTRDGPPVPWRLVTPRPFSGLQCRTGSWRCCGQMPQASPVLSGAPQDQGSRDHQHWKWPALGTDLVEGSRPADDPDSLQRSQPSSGKQLWPEASWPRPRPASHFLSRGFPLGAAASSLQLCCACACGSLRGRVARFWAHPRGHLGSVSLRKVGRGMGCPAQSPGQGWVPAPGVYPMSHGPRFLSAEVPGSTGHFLSSPAVRLRASWPQLLCLLPHVSGSDRKSVV